VGGGDGIHHPIPDARLSPLHEAVVAGRSRAIAFGQIAPRRTRAQHPEYTVEHTAIIDARHASGLVERKRFDHAPLEVSKIISAHADVESDRDAIWKVPIGT